MPSLKKYLSKGLIALIAAVGGAFLESTTDIIKKNFEPALIGVRNTYEDWTSPLPEDAQIGIHLQTYTPSPSGDEPWAEAVTATIPANSCRKTDGYSIVRAFDESPNGHRTNAIMMIHCRPSGRISINLATQSGEVVQIFEGRFKDGEKAGFPGVSGSYSAGVMTMHRLDVLRPGGPWRDLPTRDETQP
ncbi:hypothetical protein ACI77I_29675 [Pseudomonas sp. D47]|uniref:hypothetical protein n=1 Tax=Pseudomonas sp. D47 TaxID=3159447 RepID=UPI00387B7F27